MIELIWIRCSIAAANTAENWKPLTTKTIISVKWFNPLSANPTIWSNALKQFVGKLLTNCLSIFAHFVGLALKGLSAFFASRKIDLTHISNLSLFLWFIEGRFFLTCFHSKHGVTMRSCIEVSFCKKMMSTKTLQS